MTTDTKKKPQYATGTSPAGTARYPKLNVPDTKFNAKGVYSVKLRLDADDATNLAFIGKLEEHQKAAIEAALPQWEEAKAADKKKKLKGDITEHCPFWLDEETNEYEVNFKMYASYTDKKTGEEKPLKPALFDAKLKPLKKGTEVTGGSTVKVAFDIIPFFQPATGAGVKLQLKAVQVIDLKVWGANPDQLGFTEEDGFDASSVEDEADENGFTATEDGEEGADF